ncbi:M15 family metallopeptidase [Isoptericola sp. BMS4]|uniref:M15 family metallopeptidase n=1 Tax=Isoptericola sp. BMS4 TaxID=2527875 RepID=UPI00196A7070|nr:M15 family metallopeptidase [Isoptericola sp. BMS4]
MKHARHRSTPADPISATTGATRARPESRQARGRHSAGRARRPSPLAALAPRSWPLSVGVGLAVTVATTTSFTVASPGALDPHRTEDAGATASAAGAAAAAVDREGAASRAGERSAPAAAKAPRSGRAATGLVVPRDVTMSGGDATTAQIAAAPEPPVLPGCDGEASGTGSNGYVPDSELCDLWDGYPAIRADAAVALARLNEAYRATFGESMCLTDGYRSYAQQLAVRAEKGTLAAPPGTSNHGWGLAVDICADSYAGDRWDWLAANAPAYGWDNPDWARPGGSKYEPWHWEYTAAVAAKTGY